MKDENKTKERLIQELIKMREKIANLEEITIEGKRVKSAWVFPAIIRTIPNLQIN